MARASRASSGDRRLAPRRLGSGRRGRADAEARRHGRVRADASGAVLSQSPRERCGRDVADQSAAHRRTESSRRRSTSVRTSRGGRGSSRTSTFTRKPPFTLTYHIRPKARWSDGDTRSPRGTSCSPTRAILKHGSPDGPRTDRGSQRPGASTRRQSGSCCDLASRGGAGCSGASCRGTRYVAKICSTVWKRPDRQPEDRQADRERPFPRRALGARQADHAPPKPAVLGAASLAPRPNRHPFRGRRPGAARSSGFRQRRVRGRPRDSAAQRLSGGSGVRPSLRTFTFPSSRLGTLRDPHRSAAAIPALRSKLVRRALAFGVDRGRARTRDVSGHRSAEHGSATASSYPTPSRYYRSNWSTYRYRPAEARRLLELGGLPPWRGRHLRLRRRAALASLCCSRHSRWQFAPGGRARPGAAAASRCRGDTDLCSAGCGLRLRSSRAARSTSRSSLGTQARIRR